MQPHPQQTRTTLVAVIMSRSTVISITTFGKIARLAAGRICTGSRAIATSSQDSSPAAKARILTENVVQENEPGRVHFMIEMNKERVSWSEALKCLRAYSLRSVPETVQLSVIVNMLLKGKKTKEAFKGSLKFPHSFGEVRQVLLLAEDEVLEKNGSADLKEGEAVISKFERDLYKKKFDVVITTPTMYPKMKHLQSVLRAKMPSPRTGTVVEGDEVDEAIAKVKLVKAFRSSRSGTINCSVGKLDFEDSMLEDNMKYLVRTVLEHKGSLSDVNFLKRLTLSTSYGPGFDIFVTDLL